MSEFKTLVDNMNVKVSFDSGVLNTDDGWTNHKYRARITRNGKTFSTTYHTGLAYNAPDKYDLIYCLVLDTFTYLECDSAEQLAYNFGMDDSEAKKSKQTYNSLKIIHDKMLKLFTMDELEDLASEDY